MSSSRRRNSFFLIYSTMYEICMYVHMMMARLQVGILGTHWYAYSVSVTTIIQTQVTELCPSLAPCTSHILLFFIYLFSKIIAVTNSRFSFVKYVCVHVCYLLLFMQYPLIYAKEKNLYIYSSIAFNVRMSYVHSYK